MWRTPCSSRAVSRKFTIRELRDAGATHFSWMRPGEFNDRVPCPDGAFAYKFADGSAHFYAVVQEPVLTRYAIDEELDEGEAWVLVRNGTREPRLEQPCVFHKDKGLDENIQFIVDNAGAGCNFPVVEGHVLGMRVKTKGQMSPLLTYEQFRTSKHKGTVMEPWIIFVGAA